MADKRQLSAYIVSSNLAQYLSINFCQDGLLLIRSFAAFISSTLATAPLLSKSIVFKKSLLAKAVFSSKFNSLTGGIAPRFCQELLCSESAFI
jgi:hypothetical protein